MALNPIAYWRYSRYNPLILLKATLNRYTKIAVSLAFVAGEYERGRSLRELAELTGRTQTAVRRALYQAGVRRRGRGARPVSEAQNL